jgi:predicted CDP-diglyceride synthetase/phosphatidate cytidylyltransferase
MPDVIAYLIAGLTWAVLIAAVVAVVDVARRPKEAFPAVDRQTKVFWLIMLVLSGLLVSPLVGFKVIGLLGLISVVIVVLYFVDVRPKLVEITRR